MEKIDAGALRPRARTVVRAFHSHMSLANELQQKALSAFDRGASDTDTAQLRSEIWSAINKLELSKQSGLRLSQTLIAPDQQVDWYLAEYLIEWAKQQGLSDDQIVAAFHA